MDGRTDEWTDGKMDGWTDRKRGKKGKGKRKDVVWGLLGILGTLRPPSFQVKN